MAVEQGLFQFVTQDPKVQAAVGVDKTGTTKAHWILAPQGSILPFLVFSRVSTSDTYTMHGTTKLRDAVYQIVCYSTSYYGSRSVADVVRKLLQDYQGTLPDGTIVNAMFIEKDWDAQYEEGSKNFIYGAYLQFRTWYFD